MTHEPRGHPGLRLAVCLVAAMGCLLPPAVAAADLEVRIYSTPLTPSRPMMLIPRSDLVRLSAAAQSPATASTRPAERPEASIREACFTFEPGYPVTRGEVVFDVRPSGKGWKRVSLMGPGVHLARTAASSTSGPVALLPSGRPELYLLDAQVPVRLTQTFTVNVTREGNKFTARAEIPLAAINRVRLEKTGGGQRDFRLAHGILDPATLSGSLQPSTALVLTWTTAEAAATAGPGTTETAVVASESTADARPQISSDLYLVGQVTDRTVRLQGTVHLEVARRPVPRTVLELPTGAAVVDTRSPQLADWSVETASGAQRLVIEWKTPVTGQVQVELMLEVAREGEAPFEVGLPAVLGAYREKAWLGLSSQGNLQIDSGRPPLGIRAVDPAQAPAEMARPGDRPLGLLFSATRHPGAGPSANAVVQLQVVRHEQVKVLTAVADLAEIWTHAARDGIVLHRAHLLVKNNTEQFLRIRLPKDAQVLDSFVSQAAVVPAVAPTGELLIPLEKSGVANTQAAAFPVDLTFREKRDPLRDGSLVTFTLPQVHLPVSTLRWKLATPRDLEAQAVRTNLQADLTYREVSYAGESGEQQTQTRGRKLFEENAPPLSVPFPPMSQFDNYSLDIVDPGSAAPFLEARIVVRQTSRTNRSLAFSAALLLAFGLILHSPTARGRRIRAIVILVLSGIAVGITSFRPEALALGLYFALGMFLGVAVALVRWSADWRRRSGSHEEAGGHASPRASLGVVADLDQQASLRSDQTPDRARQP